MSFKIEWTEVAIRDLDKLDILLKKRIIKKVVEFAEMGSFHGIKRMAGYDSLYRLRVGYFRVLFEFRGGVIYVAKVGHRKNIY